MKQLEGQSMPQSMKNVPYKKVHIKGVLINPITKEKPYLHQYATTRAIKNMVKNVIKSNKNITNGKRN